MPIHSVHSEHCRECKLRLHELLVGLYGECLINHSFGWACNSGAYAGSPVGDTLASVFEALGRHRGYWNFIRTPEIPPCDYYVKGPGFIVELDESQHFTKPRRVTLDCYTPDLVVGFDIREWAHLCDVLQSEDPTPPDRDERRAWYDCLRDLLPIHFGLQPTARLYAAAFPWCSLRSSSIEDRRRFEALLGLGREGE